MPRFFIDTVPAGGTYTITGADAVHIGRSLRMRIGDELTLCRRGTEYLCRIEGFTTDTVTVEIMSAQPSANEPSLGLTVYQALPKSDKAEFIIQKCTELGASELVFFESKRCVAHLTDPDKKLVRYERIALEAAKQSGRGLVPQVRYIPDMAGAVRELVSHETPLLCYEKDGSRLSDVAVTSDTAVMIGSEGGFDPEEADLAAQMGAKPIWLGNRILRCETAPVAVTAILMHIFGDI